MNPTSRLRRFCVVLLALVTFSSAVITTGAAESAHRYDLVVYGGTSGGVIAAVQAARMMASVLLIEPGQHVGGVSSGGLGATDFGHPDSIGGISREFYRRVKQYYANPAVWKYEKPGDYRSHRHDPAADVMFHFEPHVAEQIYREMVREAGVTVVFGERLDLQRGVEKVGPEIGSLTMELGRRFAGKMFIDASYEGDVMAKAGVIYTVGRESPRDSWSLWNRYRFENGPVKGLGLGVGVVFVGERRGNPNLVNNPGIRSPAFHRWQANASYATKLFERKTTFALNVNNVFDQFYRQSFSGLGEPRSVTGSVTFEF